jgi:hypothetical protein
MDKELEREKAVIDALITEFSEQLDRVNDLQREIGGPVTCLFRGSATAACIR